jgi:uncharacterized membrane protein
MALGWIAWPIARKIFRSWEDQGYAMSKILGAAGVSFGMWLAGSAHILPFTWEATVGVAAFMLGIGVVLNRIWPEKANVNKRLIIGEEILFLAALIFWSWVKAHEPTINGLEKFMDFGFARSILQGKYFPPADMWFAGQPINYYYFGHLLMAVVTRLSNLDLAYTFNLMLAVLFALAVTMSLAIGKQLLRHLPRPGRAAGAALIAFLVALSGNLHTIYAFTKGYSGDNPPPFWTIWSDFSSWKSIQEGWRTYWYPNATRFIPYTIHEFPSYSFVVSDIHGHVLSIPLALLLIALLVNMLTAERKIGRWEYGVYGMTAGWAFMTNALDGPIYLGLLIACLIIINWKNADKWKSALAGMGIAMLIFGLTILPFIIHFKPFVSGIGVNCPPAKLANSKIGPFVFETVDKCQKSPLWMMLVLWGFFVYSGIRLAGMKLPKEEQKNQQLLLVWGLVCTGLIIFPEFFYFKDIYPLHFRSNTMFKLGYQAFMMMSIASGYTITQALRSIKKNKLWLTGLMPLLFLVSIYPSFAVKSYFDNLRIYHGLYGLEWLQTKYPDDWAAMNWLVTQNPPPSQPVILEAAGDSYTDYDRFSAFTGLPTVEGWLVHEWLWRGYELSSARTEEVRIIYEMTNPEQAKILLGRYKVKYIVVGDLERQKYTNINEPGISALARPVYAHGTTIIYQVY